MVFYTESLKSSDVLIQTGSCLALKCLRVSRTREESNKQFFFSQFLTDFVAFQATESVEQITDLCRSADEDLRGVAKETVLSFGNDLIDNRSSPKLSLKVFDVS